MMQVLMLGAGYMVVYFAHKARMKRLACFAAGTQETRNAWREFQTDNQ